MKKNKYLQQALFYRVCSKKFLRIMKLTTLLLTIAICHTFAGSSYSQNTRLNLDIKDATIKDVLTLIEDQSEFLFMYS